MSISNRSETCKSAPEQKLTTEGAPGVLLMKDPVYRLNKIGKFRYKRGMLLAIQHLMVKCCAEHMKLQNNVKNNKGVDESGIVGPRAT